MMTRIWNVERSTSIPKTKPPLEADRGEKHSLRGGDVSD